MLWEAPSMSSLYRPASMTNRVWHFMASSMHLEPAPMPQEEPVSSFQSETHGCPGSLGPPGVVTMLCDTGRGGDSHNVFHRYFGLTDTQTRRAGRESAPGHRFRPIRRTFQAFVPSALRSKPDALVSAQRTGRGSWLQRPSGRTRSTAVELRTAEPELSLCKIREAQGRISGLAHRHLLSQLPARRHSQAGLAFERHDHQRLHSSQLLRLCGASHVSCQQPASSGLWI